MGQLGQDIRFAAKLLLKDKSFNLVALLTLALCIGANTAIFSVVNSVLLRPLPYPEADRLVEFYNAYPGVGVPKGENAAPDYADRKKATDVFEEVAAIDREDFNAGVEGSPERLRGLEVTPSFFRLHRISPVLGRMFSEEEGQVGNDKVAILSHGLWQRLYGGSREALGRDIRLNGNLHRVVGVMPEGFFDRRVQLFVPLAFSKEQLSDDRRHSNSWGMVGRLQPGVSLEQAQARINAINKANEALFTEHLDLLKKSGFHTKVVWRHAEMVKDIQPTLYILQAAVAFVLLIGCVNVANLFLVRANIRLKELSIRAALGAGRWRLGRLLLTESVLLGAVGGMAGFGVGVGGVKLLRYLGAERLPRGEEIGVDLSMLAFTAGVAVLTGLIFGAIPLVHVLRANLAAVFRETGRSGTAERPALVTRSILVVAQVALAFVLLVGSGLLISSFLRVLDVNPGFEADRVLTARLSLPRARYENSAQIRPFIGRALESIRSLPGIRGAGMITFLPFGSQHSASATAIEGRQMGPDDLPPVPAWAHVDSDYFRVMGIPLLRGRVIEENDTGDAQKVVVIDQFLAVKYCPDASPIGQRIRAGIEADDPIFTIVGVVGSVKNNDLTDKDPMGLVYFSYKQRFQRGFTLVMKQERIEAPLVAPITAEILGLDPELPLSDVKAMTTRVDESLVDRRAAVWLAAIFAALALVLSAIGIYGVLAYAVSQRTREIGIRMALGAEAGSVLRSVAGHGLRLAGIGLVIGLSGAYFLTRLMQSLLFEVAPRDPLVYASVTGVLVGVALLASLIPSFRATRIDPATALRYE